MCGCRRIESNRIESNPWVWFEVALAVLEVTIHEVPLLASRGPLSVPTGTTVALAARIVLAMQRIYNLEHVLGKGGSCGLEQGRKVSRIRREMQSRPRLDPSHRRAGCYKLYKRFYPQAYVIDAAVAGEGISGRWLDRADDSVDTSSSTVNHPFFARQPIVCMSCFSSTLA